MSIHLDAAVTSTCGGGNHHTFDAALTCDGVPEKFHFHGVDQADIRAPLTDDERRQFVWLGVRIMFADCCHGDPTADIPATLAAARLATGGGHE